MAHVLFEYLQKQKYQMVEEALRPMDGQPTSTLVNDAWYRRDVIQAAWQKLPLPIRLLGRRDLRWDEYFLCVRKGAFDYIGGNATLRRDWRDIMVKLAREFFGPPEEATPASAPNTAAPTQLAPTSPFGQAPRAGNPPMAIPIKEVPASPARASSSSTAGEKKPAANGQRDVKDVPVGIDLGTTYSLVAYIDAQGRPCCIANSSGDLLTPSVVLFDEGGTVVGKEAVLASALEPLKVAECVKRDMGAKSFHKEINGEHMPPEVISSFVLKSLKTDAERRLGLVRRAVITVPAYFDEPRRRATMDAGKLAGLEVLDIINEPTAAAIAYGYNLGFLDRNCKLNRTQPLRILVYDLGGGTFDVTIVEIKGQAFKALATDGDVYLGGRDWDQKLVDLAAEKFKQQCNKDPRDNPVSQQELWLAAEAAKRTLTERRKANLFVNHAGTRLKVEVTRDEFEDATSPLLERTRLTSEIVVRQAGLGWKDIDRIVLVGGSTRMPMVVRMLEELTSKPIDRTLPVDEAVALGAALYAELLAEQKGPSAAPAAFEVTNVNSHSLGIQSSDPKSGRKYNSILLPKNTSLPHTITKTFKTFKPNQRNVAIRVLEGESDKIDACTRVGVCAIRDLPAELPAGWPVLVSYTYEANGRLHVTAKLLGHQAGVTTDFHRENSMPDEEVELWAHYIDEEMVEKE